MKLGYKIKELRKERNWSREQLSNKLGMSYSTIAKYEVDDRYPDLDKLVKIADLFDISVDELLDRDTQPSNKATFLSNEQKKQIISGLKEYIDDFDFDAYMKENLKPKPQKEYKFENYIAPNADEFNYDALVDLRTFMIEHGMQNDNFAAYDLNEIASLGPKEIAKMKINLLKARDRERRKS